MPETVSASEGAWAWGGVPGGARGPAASARPPVPAGEPGLPEARPPALLHRRRDGGSAVEVALQPGAYQQGEVEAVEPAPAPGDRLDIIPVEILLRPAGANLLGLVER